MGSGGGVSRGGGGRMATQLVQFHVIVLDPFSVLITICARLIAPAPSISCQTRASWLVVVGRGGWGEPCRWRAGVRCVCVHVWGEGSDMQR